MNRKNMRRIVTLMMVLLLLVADGCMLSEKESIFAATAQKTEQMILSQNLKGDTKKKKIVKKPTLSDVKINLKKGTQKKLKVSNTKESIRWVSSDKSIATVSKSGVVKGVSKGKVVIKAKLVTSGKTLKCVVNVTNEYKPSQVEDLILAYQKQYPEGMRFTNDDYYLWNAIHCHCYGCIAFVGTLSDGIFGVNAPVTMHTDFDKIKSGDHVRIGAKGQNMGYHSVMVISKEKDTLTIVEANYNESVHWNRQITKAELEQEGFYVETRY